MKARKHKPDIVQYWRRRNEFISPPLFFNFNHKNSESRCIAFLQEADVMRVDF